MTDPSPPPPLPQPPPNNTTNNIIREALYPHHFAASACPAIHGTALFRPIHDCESQSDDNDKSNIDDSDNESEFNPIPRATEQRPQTNRSGEKRSSNITPSPVNVGGPDSNSSSNPNSINNYSIDDIPNPPKRHMTSNNGATTSVIDSSDKMTNSSPDVFSCLYSDDEDDEATH
jgi:hypothetical protein